MPEMASFLTKMIEMPWLAGILVAAPFAAVMSTMDSFLLMISSSFVRDIYQRKYPDASEEKIKKVTYITTMWWVWRRCWPQLIRPIFFRS